MTEQNQTRAGASSDKWKEPSSTGDDAESEAFTTLVDLIDRLVEPTAPDPVPLTPQTWGWAILAAVVAAALALFIRRQLLRYRANAYRREALAELASCGDDPAEVAAILRRAALCAWPRGQVASLTGQAWLRFLDDNGGFPRDEGAELLSAPWRPDRKPSPSLRRAAEDWIRNHRVTFFSTAAEPRSGPSAAKPGARSPVSVGGGSS